MFTIIALIQKWKCPNQAANVSLSSLAQGGIDTAYCDLLGSLVPAVQEQFARWHTQFNIVKLDYLVDLMSGCCGTSFLRPMSKLEHAGLGGPCASSRHIHILDLCKTMLCTLLLLCSFFALGLTESHLGTSWHFSAATLHGLLAGKGQKMHPQSTRP